MATAEAVPQPGLFDDEDFTGRDDEDDVSAPALVLTVVCGHSSAGCIVCDTIPYFIRPHSNFAVPLFLQLHTPLYRIAEIAVSRPAPVVSAWY